MKAEFLSPLFRELCSFVVLHGCLEPLGRVQTVTPRRYEAAAAPMFDWLEEVRARVA
jgi:hypothetical protein